MDDTWVKLAFLSAFASDRAAGRSRPLAHYLEQFPGHEDVITREYAATSAGDTPSPGELLVDGRYRIERPLGHGGQASVFLAEDLRLRRKVALKLLAPGVLANADRSEMRLLREAGLTSRLDIPGICTIHDVGRYRGRVYVAMRYVPGDTLAEWIRRAADQGRPVGDLLADAGAGTERSELLVVGLIETVARAVHVAHEAGIVHRDLKPGNILVTPHGDPVVIDFGLAQDSGHERTSGISCGTPAYMAPEQIRGDRKKGAAIDARTDVWALGVVLYECLLLRPPFAGTDREALYHAILTQEPDCSWPGLSRDLRAILTTAMQKDRVERFATAAAFADDLGRYRRGEPVVSRPPGVLRVARRLLARNRALASVVLTVVASLVTALVLTLWFWDRERGLRTEAERGFESLHELTRSLVFDVRTAIGRLPGSAKARRLLLSRAVEYLKILEARSRTDPRLEGELAIAYVNLGDAQGHPGTESLGDHEAAQASYTRAKQIVDAMRKKRPESAGLRLLEARILQRLGDVLVMSGDLTAGKARFEAALRLGATVARDAAPAGVWERTMMPVRSHYGLLLDSLGRPAEAFSELERALAIARSKQMPKQALAGALVNIALLEERQGELASAIAHLEEAAQVIEPEARRCPHDFDVRDRLAAVYVPLARMHAAVGNHAEADREFRRVLEILEDTSRESGRAPLAERRLASARCTYASVLRLRERNEEAKALLEAAVASGRKLASRDGANAYDRDCALHADLALADFLVEREPCRTLELLRAAESLLAPEDRQPAEHRRLRIDIGYLRGKALVKSDEAGAYSAWKRALSLAESSPPADHAYAGCLIVAILSARAEHLHETGKQRPARRTLRRVEQLLAHVSQHVPPAGEARFREAEARVTRLLAASDW